MKTRILKNIQVVLEAAGSGLGKVIKINVYVTDMGKFAEMNSAYPGVFEEPQPVRFSGTFFICGISMLTRLTGSHLRSGFCPSFRGTGGDGMPGAGLGRLADRQPMGLFIEAGSIYLELDDDDT